MKFRWDSRYIHWGVTAFLVVAASMLFYYGIFHMSTLITGIKVLLRIMAPIIYGIVIAFLLSPVLNFMERNIIYPLLKKKNIEFEKKGKKVIRWICVILCVFLMFVLIYTLIMMILPQLLRSVMNLIYNFPKYVTVVQNWLQKRVEKGWNLNDEAIDMIDQYSIRAQEYLTSTILPQMQNMLKNISAGVFDILIFLKNFLIGAIVSLYLLADKEGFVAKGKMITYALLPTRRANFLIHSMRFTSQTFIGFISGKVLDSAIIGVMCYVGCTIMNLPYTLLISVIVGATNVIPFFGPYLGAIPCFFLILLVDPMQSLYFAVFILALQQFDGNILGPKILGDSTGLSSFMVIVSILIGGGLFGVPGMLIGVPVFAVLYAAACRGIRILLNKKAIPTDETEYINIDCLDEHTRERVLMPEPEKSEKTQGSQRRTAMLEISLAILRTLKKILITIWEFLKKYSIKICQWIVKYAQKFWQYLKSQCGKVKEKFRKFREDRQKK